MAADVLRNYKDLNFNLSVLKFHMMSSVHNKPAHCKTSFFKFKAAHFFMT